MAITINQDPNSSFVFSPSHNPNEYLVNSDNSTEPNFKVNCLVYYDTTGANTLLATLKKPIVYGTTKVILDISSIVMSKDFEAYPYFLSSGTVNTLTEMKQWQVVFREYYGTTPVLTGSSASGATFPAWHGDFRYKDWQNNNYRKYVGISGQNKKYLTNFENYEERNVFDPETTFNIISSSTAFRNINYNQTVYVCSLISQITGSATLNIALFDSDYTQIQYKQLNSAAVTSKPYRCDWRITPSSLVADYGFTSGEVADAKYIQCYMSIPTNYVITKAYMFEIDRCDNPKFSSTYELMWLNRQGGWDGMIFDGKFKKNTIIDKQFLKNDVTRRISGSTIVNDAFARRKKQFQTSVVEQYTINSSNLLQIEYNALEDLFTSSNVFWKDDSTWRSINVIDTNYEGKTNRVDRIMNTTLTFEVDMNNTLQQW